MGRWGERFFEGDHDFDEASDISADAGIELFYYELDGPGAQHPTGCKGLKATQDHLNNGVLNSLFEKYLGEAEKNGFLGSLWEKYLGRLKFFYGRELRLIHTAVLAMRVGATIEPKYMDMLRAAYLKIDVAPKYSSPLSDTGFRGPMKEQFEIALNHYKNDGTPYDFFAPRCKGPGCDKANVELGKGVKLRACGKCKEISYCSKKCQKAHWSKHKKECKTPAQRKAEEDAKWAGQPYQLINV